MTDEESFNDIYLNLQIKKSKAESGEAGKTDENGNYIFEVEASNENLDLQNQVVLQRALMESKDEFLKGGVISVDHLHRRKEKGKTVVDNTKVIGEPIDVYTDGKSTIVKGILYANNAEAKPFIDMLKAGSTRVRASVGGIFPKVVKDVKKGFEKITHVLWNDLALTTSPVNNTVGCASFAKSMDPEEFCKALAAGYGTDHSQFTDGRALVAEDVEGEVTDETEEEKKRKEAEEFRENYESKNILKSLIDGLLAGEIKGKYAAEDFLMEKGFSLDEAEMAVQTIINNGGEMMKKSFGESIHDLLKSLKGDEIEEEVMEKAEKEEDDSDTIDLDDEDIDLNDEEDGEDEEEVEKSKEGCKKSCKKSLDEDDDFVDGTEILKSLADSIANIESRLADLENEQNARSEEMGKSLQDVAEMVAVIGNQKMPVRSVMNKSIDAAAEENHAPKGCVTPEGFKEAKAILHKSYLDGEISLAQSSAFETEIQKAMTGTRLSDECWNFLKGKISN